MVGGGDIEEDRVREKIQQGQAMIHWLEELMVRDEEGTVNTNYATRISELMDSNCVLEKRLEKLYAYNNASASFFSEYEVRLAELEAGAAAVSNSQAWNASTGTFNIKKLDMNWAKPITKAWKERQEKINRTTLDYKLANQEIKYHYDQWGTFVGVTVDGEEDYELSKQIQTALAKHDWDFLKQFGTGFAMSWADAHGGKDLAAENLIKRPLPAGEIKGNVGYITGQMAGNIFSLVEGGATFIGGALWLAGGDVLATITIPFTGGSSAVAIPAISLSGLSTMALGGGVFLSAAKGFGDIDFGGDRSYTNKNGEWGAGSFDSPEDCLEYHFNQHGAEVGAKDIEQFKRKAQEFARTCKKGVKPTEVFGETPGVKRFRKNGKYIDLAPDGSIISFGST